jgi:hypothetical protein
MVGGISFYFYLRYSSPQSASLKNSKKSENVKRFDGEKQAQK